MICWATRIKVPAKIDKVLTYRSYRNFNEINYQQDLSNAPFHVCEIFDNMNDSYWYCNTLLTNIIDDHAQVKTRKIEYKHVPYMNSELRNAFNVRNML